MGGKDVGEACHRVSHRELVVREIYSKSKQLTIDKMVLGVQRHEEKIQILNKLVNNNQVRDKQTTTKINYDQEKRSQI